LTDNCISVKIEKRSLYSGERTTRRYGNLIFARELGGIDENYIPNPFITYVNIFPDERSKMEKGLMKLGIIKYIKPLREIMREEYGFSKVGCLNYPQPTSFSRWVTFTPH